MFGGCRSPASAEAAPAPEPKAVAPSFATEIRVAKFQMPDFGDLSLKCAYTRQVTGDADRMSALFEGMPVFESVTLSPTSPGSYRLEVYHLIPANSYRIERTRVTFAKFAGNDIPLNESHVVYAAKDVDERVLAGKVEASVALDILTGRSGSLSTPLKFREGVPNDLFSSLWIEVFAMDPSTSTERLVGAGSVGCMSSGSGRWVPSFWPEDVSKVGSPDSQVTSVREQFKLL